MTPHAHRRVALQKLVAGPYLLHVLEVSHS
jgi:hypothetical protein